MTDPMAEKQALRRDFLDRRKALTPDERKAFDAAIAARIFALDCWREARGVAAYASDGTEPDLAEVCRRALREKKLLALPRFAAASGEYEPAGVTDWERDLVPGRYGLAEPRPELAAVRPGADWLWLIPGVAFDECGTRLGRGKGFYDRMLARYDGTKIGVFYQMQFFAGRLPEEAHDRKLDWAVTERKTLIFAPERTTSPSAPEHHNQRKTNDNAY